MTSENFTRPGAVDLSGLAQQAATAEGGAGYVVELTEAEFETVASRSMQHPVVVEFYSPRDPNGAPVSEALASSVNAGEGRYLLARVNVDQEPRIAQALGVQAVPTVIALLAGQMVPLFQGTKSREEIADLLGQVSQAAVANGITGRAEPIAAANGNGEGPEHVANPRFEAADAALEAGDYSRAVREFDKLLAETPGDPEAVAGRAQAALLERSLRFDVDAIRAAADGGGLQAQLDAADLDVIQGRYEEALDRLLDFAATADADDKEAVRVRLLELFEVVGRTDPLVLKARRRLSTVLF